MFLLFLTICNIRPIQNGPVTSSPLQTSTEIIPSPTWRHMELDNVSSTSAIQPSNNNHVWSTNAWPFNGSEDSQRSAELALVVTESPLLTAQSSRDSSLYSSLNNSSIAIVNWNVTAELPFQPWAWHPYVFGTSFCLAALFSAVALVHAICWSPPERIYFFASSVSLFAFCLTRCYHLLKEGVVDSLPAEDDVRSPDLLYQTSSAVLTMSVMLLFSATCLFCQVSWWKFRPVTSTAVNGFIVPYSVVAAALTLLSIAFRLADSAHNDGVVFCLVVFHKTVNLLWGAVFIAIAFSIFRRLYKASILKQSHILRATLTKLHIEGGHLPRKLPEPNLRLCVGALGLAALLLLTLNVVLAYGLFLAGDFALVIDASVPLSASDSDWVYRTIVRTLEAGCCGCSALAHFWCCSGHRCRPAVRRVASLFAPRRESWQPTPKEGERLWRCRNATTTEDVGTPFEISHAPATGGSIIPEEPFPYEEWKQDGGGGGGGCRDVTNKKSDIERQDRIRPTLRTFQRLAQVSPGRLQPLVEHHGRPTELDRQRRGSNTVVAGLKSLAASRRSSSSSCSSVSAITGDFGRATPSWRRPSAHRNAENSSGALPKNDIASGGNSRDWKLRRCTKHDNVLTRRAWTSDTKICKDGSRALTPKGRRLSSIRGSASKAARKKPRHLDRGVRKVEDSCTTSKDVLMVSRATQVYIPSPNRHALEQLHGACRRKALSRSNRRQAKDLSGNTHDSRSALTRPSPSNVLEPYNLKRSWQVANSSTSCSSESAANSFDVRFYVYGSSPEAATPSDSSPSHDFHDHFYPKIYAKTRTDLLISDCNNPSSEPQDETGQQTDSTTLLTPADKLQWLRQPNLPMSNLTAKDVKAPPECSPQSVPNDNHPTLNLSLPLADIYTSGTQKEKNAQDITPDSAVYLEINLSQHGESPEPSTAALSRQPHDGSDDERGDQQYPRHVPQSDSDSLYDSGGSDEFLKTPDDVVHKGLPWTLSQVSSSPFFQ